MRLLFSIARFSAMAAAVCGLLLVTACPKQENFPEAIDVTVPATPSNFVITNSSGTLYTFEWQAVPGAVNYRLYLLGGGLGPDEFLAETTVTQIPDLDLGAVVKGLQFAVSAVNAEHVEGFRAVAVAP
jgi:hypothetical protein